MMAAVAGGSQEGSGFWKYALVLTVVAAFSVLLFGGVVSFDKAPPVPDRVVDENGSLLFEGSQIWGGQAVYQQHGLMEYGSVLGNGAMRGPDFTAATVQLTLESMREFYARSLGAASYEALSAADRAAVDSQVRSEMQANRFDPATGTLALTSGQVYALEQVEAHYRKLFAEGDPEAALPAGLVRADEQPAQQRAWVDAGDPITQISRFFFWTGWASTARRPGETYSYTNNWPYAPEAGNTVTYGSIVASAVSVALLVLLLAIIFWAYSRYRLSMEPAPALAAALEDSAHRSGAGGEPGARNRRPSGSGGLALDPSATPLTPSQRATAKFLVLVAALFLAQTLLGGYMAHAYVEPTFFGIDLNPLLPFPVARTWHLQLAIFWIATAWVAAGLYLAPVVGGDEPKHQAKLVNVLFVALVVVAAGSLAGEWLGVKGYLGKYWFLLGHQGWEYTDLGRVWQYLLAAGLLLWLGIVFRAMRRGLARQGDAGSLPHLLLYASVATPFFYGFALLYNPGTNVTIAEYWRWWVIHLWVEGIFEVFTLVVAAVLFTHLGLVTERSALRATYFQLILVLGSGIIGTAHHYYFVGLPEMWLSLGAVFSALEVIPLTLLGLEAYEQYRLVKAAGKPFPYKTVFWFLIATAIWNLLGAGVLGFLINLPAVNYFEHGTFLTAAHGHGALMGVYGMLAVALLLYVLRNVVRPEAWSERAVKLGFAGLNLGLAGMLATTLIPVGLGQLAVSVNQGFAVARDPAFYQVPWVKALLWLRMLPDTVFIALGVVPILCAAVKGYRNTRVAEAAGAPLSAPSAGGRRQVAGAGAGAAGR